MRSPCDRLRIRLTFSALSLLLLILLVHGAVTFDSTPLREIWNPPRVVNVHHTLQTEEEIVRNISAHEGTRMNSGVDVDNKEYFNVNSQNWDDISTYLNDESHPIDSINSTIRAKILVQTFESAKSGELSYETALNLANFLKREKHYLPWSAALDAFDDLDPFLVDQPQYPVFKRYVLRLMDKVYQHFRIKNPQTNEEKLVNYRLQSWACRLGEMSCTEMVANFLKSYTEENKPVPKELDYILYCKGMSTLSNDYWEELWNKYSKCEENSERELILRGLSCASEESYLKKLLQRTIIDGSIREHEVPVMFSAIYNNPIGVRVAIEFLDETFEDITRFSEENLEKAVSGVANMIRNQKQMKDFENVLQKYGSDFGINQTSALLMVQNNLQWASEYTNTIFSLLEQRELEEYFLPELVTPQHYILKFSTDLEDKTFSGEMYIRIIAQTTTDTITLHSNGLTITFLKVYNADSYEEENLIESYSFDVELDFLKIYLTEYLNLRSTYYIVINFDGTLRDDMYGFYVSTYKDDQDNDKKLAATQFQPTHARKAFPCFDEPKFKATFSIAVKTPPHYHALGNMKTMHTRVWGDYSTESQFMSTPQMSTYLVAFVVSDFEELEEIENGIVYRTWARPNALSWGAYSMQITKPLLQNLEEFTAYTYYDRTLSSPFDKVDQVALPDFSAGAMENWGLITYRETALLYNDGTASAQKSVATIIAHELTHMWFGNLVTTRWWDATWLNEGFAQYLQYYITSLVLPEWRLMDQFVVDHHQAIFASDALASAEALTSPAYTPTQVSAKFSSITYSKGASILRMLSHILGEDNFRRALQLYLNNQRYSTVTPDDLFEHLLLHSHDSDLHSRYFKGLFQSWTEQPGFPVITVSRDYVVGTVVIYQNRFLLKESSTSDTTQYFVPLTWAIQGEDFSPRKPQMYLRNDQAFYVIPDRPDTDQWIVVNIQVTGYYRVNYDTTNWELLAKYLKDESNPLDGIHLLNRAQLLDDAFNLARAGYLPYDNAFELSLYLRRETDYIPWASFFSALSYLQRMLINNEKYYRFQNYVQYLIETQYNVFNFEDRDTHIEKLLLNRVSSWACSVQHSRCTESARDALQRLLDQNEPVPADLRSVVYCYGIRHSSNDYWYKLFEVYISSKDNAERALIMAGLACSHDKDILQELLGYSINENYIRKQDGSSVFSSVYGNSQGVEVALNFLDDNFGAVRNYYGSMGAINNIVVGIAGRLTTEDQRDKMVKFLDQHNEYLEETVETALEIVDENLIWLDRHEEDIIRILQEYEVSPTDSPNPDPTTTEPTATTQGSEGLGATALLPTLLLIAGFFL